MKENFKQFWLPVTIVVMILGVAWFNGRLVQF